MDGIDGYLALFVAAGDLEIILLNKENHTDSSKKNNGDKQFNDGKSVSTFH
ncbi:hypothetical protein D9M69_567670 [compost metagenome]